MTARVCLPAAGVAILVSIALLVAIPRACRAAEQEDLQRVLDIGAPSLPASLHIRWESETHAGMTAEEMDEMRRRVHGKPDHPDRATLQAEDRILAEGPERVTRDVFTGPDGAFRYSETSSKGDTLDVVISDSVVWTLAGGSLILTTESAPPPGRNFALHRKSAPRELSQFTLGALGLTVGLPEQRVESFRSSGSGWRAEMICAKARLRCDLEGVFVNGRPLGTRAEIRVCELAPQEVGRRFVASEPWPDSLMGPVMRLVEEYGQNGRLRFRNRLVLVEPLGEGDWFRQPGRESTVDAFRGEIRVDRVQDFLASDDGIYSTRVENDGSWVTHQPPESDARRMARRLDTAGYMLVAGLVLVIGGVWILRRRLGFA